MKRFIQFALTLTMFANIGCVSSSLSSIGIGQKFVLQNIYRLNGQLPPRIRRVAVFPTTAVLTTTQSEAGAELLHPVLLDELSKTRKFEVIAVTSEQLHRWTGRFRWTAEEKLPPELLPLLKTELGCDAVLFSRLNVFHSYPPLAIGWNLKLVGVDNAELVWAADEVLDAAERRVADSARHYQQGQEVLVRQLADSRSILVSPRRFGQYAANSIFATLPER